MLKNRYNVWIFIMLLFVTSCEKLEDTYSDYAGNGMIRYLGKCTDVTISPGWERLELNWKNNVDPLINKIKITWKVGETVRDTLLDKQTTSCNLRNLSDGNYEIRICCVNKEGKESLVSTVYGRPYTIEHEVVRTFTRGITKHFKIGNNLVLFCDVWQDNIVNLSLNYYNVAGEKKVYPLTKEVLKQQYFVQEDVDTEKPVTIYREGRVSGCSDLIVFPLYVLTYDRFFSTDFKLLFEEKYGLKDVNDDFVNALTELEIDYTISSFEDILYFPNLEKLILGKNRYLYPNYLSKNDSASVVHEPARSLFVLDAAHRLNELKIERYNEHYFPKKRLDYMEEKENLDVPILSYLDASDWTITNSIKDPDGYDSYVKNLLDNNPATFWETKITSMLRLYELNIDMKKMQRVTGFKIAQKIFDPGSDRISPYLMPGMIRIEVSTDKRSWEKATHIDDNTIGNTIGEVTILKMVNPKEVRYIKVVVSDQVYVKDFGVALADIAVF